MTSKVASGSVQFCAWKLKCDKSTLQRKRVSGGVECLSIEIWADDKEEGYLSTSFLHLLYEYRPFYCFYTKSAGT